MRVESLPHPPLGWNSFDCHGVFINEAQALANLEVFVQRLKPHGYEYFCLDAGWYSEYDFQFSEGTSASREGRTTNMDEYGRYVASPKLFPRGLRYLADRCHEQGVKFGIHIMRGIPRMAVEQNTPILGSDQRAADIADTSDVCLWSTSMFGVDMTKPGAQAYYDSVVAYLAENGVDFIKADDITDFPAEVEAVANAIAKVDRPIVLSLSPGDSTSRTNFAVYQKMANMIRLTGDVWDRPFDLRKVFDRWELWEDLGGPECYLDFDMIPFGELQVYRESGGDNDSLSGVGGRRSCQFSLPAKQTFLTQRALAASPLIMGGELTMSSDQDFDLITNSEMLACNQNGAPGKVIYSKAYCDVRKAVHRDDSTHGWLGLFNRWEQEPGFPAQSRSWILSAANLGFGQDHPKRFFDIWGYREIDFSSGQLSVEIDPLGVLFLRY